jgi:hypothetical protein
LLALSIINQRKYEKEEGNFLMKSRERNRVFDGEDVK